MDPGHPPSPEPDAGVGALALSVVLLTPDHADVIRRTVAHLRHQTVCDRIELLIVAPEAASLGLPTEEVAPFGRVEVIEVGPIRVLAEAKAEAVRRATTEVVAFAEDHCYPEPGWAEALVEAHRGTCAAVGPAMGNANPATSLSRAGLLLNFGCCMPPISPGSATTLPWHNTAYKRSALLAYGDDLGRRLAVEGLIFEELLDAGQCLFLEPAAQVEHVNVSRFSSWVIHTFWGGWLYAGARCTERRWPWWRRLLHAATWPAVPPLRLWRTRRLLAQRGEADRFGELAGAMVTGLVPHALGEAAGYLFGYRDAAARYSYYETKRLAHVTAGDRRWLAATTPDGVPPG